MNLETRPAKAEDYESVERLWLELNAHHVEVEPELIQPVDEYQSRESYNAVIRDPGQEILLLCDGADVVGAVWLVQRMHEGGQAIEMPVAFIQEICTKRSKRRRGYGRALMNAAERWGNARGCARLEFNVWAGNKAAISFYEALGFSYARHEMYKRLD